MFPDNIPHHVIAGVVGGWRPPSPRVWSLPKLKGKIPLGVNETTFRGSMVGMDQILHLFPLPVFLQPVLINGDYREASRSAIKSRDRHIGQSRLALPDVTDRESQASTQDGKGTI